MSSFAPIARLATDLTYNSRLPSISSVLASFQKSLSDLPNEILSEIISHLVREKQCLCRLARSSRHLSVLVRPFMTRDIDFTVFPVYSYVDRYHFLIRTIEDPVIAQSVRTITIVVTESTGYLYTRLLRALPELRTLNVVTDPSVRYPSFHINHPLPSLQNITIDGPIIELETIAKLLSFPRLETITIKENSMDVEDDEEILNFHRQKSPVLSLDFGNNDVPGLLLQQLLPRIQALQRLRCPIPFWEDDDREPPPLEHFFGPTRHSLTELVIIKCRYRDFAHFLPRMNLSRFEVLRVLEVGSCCLRAKRRRNARRGVYRILPRSLQELRIFFSSTEDIMDVDVGEYAIEPSGDAYLKVQNRCVHGSYYEKFASKYEWLKELADSKAECLPELGLVVFKGVELGNRYRHTSLVDILDKPASWFIPPNVVDAFEAAEIDVDVEVKELGSLISTFAKTRPQQRQSWLDYRRLSIKALIHGEAAG